MIIPVTVFFETFWSAKKGLRYFPQLWIVKITPHDVEVNINPRYSLFHVVNIIIKERQNSLTLLKN